MSSLLLVFGSKEDITIFSSLQNDHMNLRNYRKVTVRKVENLPEDILKITFFGDIKTSIELKKDQIAHWELQDIARGDVLYIKSNGDIDSLSSDIIEDIVFWKKPEAEKGGTIVIMGGYAWAVTAGFFMALDWMPAVLVCSLISIGEFIKKAAKMSAKKEKNFD